MIAKKVQDFLHSPGAESKNLACIYALKPSHAICVKLMYNDVFLRFCFW